MNKQKLLAGTLFQCAVGVVLVLPLLLAVKLNTLLSVSTGELLVLYAAAHLAGALVALVSPRKFVQWLLVLAVAFAAGWAVETATLMAALLAALLVFPLYRGLLYAGDGAVYGYIMHVTGIVFYVLAGLLTPFYVMLQPYAALLLLMGIVCVALSFYYFNRIQLVHAHMAKQGEPGIPANVVWLNRLMIGTVLLAVLAISQFGRIGELLARMYRSLADWINSMLPEPSGQPDPQLPAPEPSGQLPPALPSGESWALWAWLDKIMGIAAMALGLVLVPLLLYLLIKRVIVPLIARLIGYLGERRGQQTSDMYIDETEKLQKPEWRRMLRGLVRRAEAPPPKSAPNGEKLRYYYRDMLMQAIRRGYAHNAARTPNETAGALADEHIRTAYPHDKLTALYNSYRYGGQPVGERELEEAVKQPK